MKRVFTFALAMTALMLAFPVQAARWGFNDAYSLKLALLNGLINDGLTLAGLNDDDVLYLEEDIVWDQEADNSDLLVVSAVKNQYTLDLNGHKLQRNISNPVGSDGTTAISFKHVKGTGTGKLIIIDTKGGGQIIANSSVMPVGNYLSAVQFPQNCNGSGGGLYVYSGDLISQVNNNGAPNCYGIMDEYGQTVSIYNGHHSGYISLATSATPTLNLYGGTLGSSYNIGTGNFAALHITSGIQGEWKGGTIFGLGYNGSQISMIDSNSNIYINSVASTLSALNNTSSSNRKKAKIEIAEQFNLQINNNTVTTLNAEDVLGDGKVKYTYRPDNVFGGRVLYLTNATLTQISTNSDLLVILSGANVLNGDLIGYSSDVEFWSATGHPTGANATDKLTITYGAETPVLLYNGDLKICQAVGISINGQSNAHAVECDKFTLNNAWFDATVTGTGAVVNCTSNDITSTLVSGSLNGKTVSYTPDLNWQNLYILGRQLNGWDVDTEITGQGISGKVHYYGSGISMENAMIDARGMNVEAIKGQLNYISFKGTCFIISDSKSAILLNGGTTTRFSPNGSDNHLYIISGTYAINASGVSTIEFGSNTQWDPITIYSGSTAIYGNNNKPTITVYGNMDISCGSFGLPMYKVTPSIYSTRVSDYGGSVDTDGVFTKANGSDADHVVFRRGNVPTFSGTAYPIEVTGISVTDGNAADVLGNGKVSYNISSNTLSLDDANIEGWYTPGIRVSSGGLNVALSGSTAVQSSNPNGAIYTVNGDLNISGGASDSLFVFGRGMAGLNRMTKPYRTSITGGCYVSAICRDDNFIQSFRSFGMQSDSLYVDASTLYVENKSKNETNKVSLASYNSNLEPGLLLVNSSITYGEPNTSAPLLIEPTSGTGTEEIQGRDEITTKVIHEGKMYILRGRDIFTVTGQKVK